MGIFFIFFLKLMRKNSKTNYQNSKKFFFSIFLMEIIYLKHLQEKKKKIWGFFFPIFRFFKIKMDLTRIDQEKKTKLEKWDQYFQTERYGKTKSEVYFSYIGIIM